MKTKIAICAFFISIIAVVMFFSCDDPIALGSKLDIEGPIVTILSPSQRQSVPVQFDLEGTVQDYSDIDRLVIKAITNNEEISRQWRHQKGAWEISDDYGASWSPFLNGGWAGTNKLITWKITVDMAIPGQNLQEGEYTFNVQAWDKGGFSDDNSFKALVLIIDLNPPQVDISYPFLYRGKDAYTYSPLDALHAIGDADAEKTNPAYLGKFLTQEFELKWQVEDINDVWSIDLRFYNYDAVIDNDPGTGLPDNYIYKYFQNVYPPPSGINPADYIKPNGSVIIPDLTSPAGIYDQGGELKSSISAKTTVKIVAVCYDAAGNPNQEKTLGYFVYWPAANMPWIAFTDGMEEAGPLYGNTIASIEPTVFTVFPSKYIKATAYQAHGVKKVEYSIWKCDTTSSTLNNTLTFEYGGTISNTPYASGMYTNIFTVQFDVPPITGYYVIKAAAYSNKDKPSVEYEMLFRVNDITYPQFIEGPYPTASEPLFKAINSNKIKIEGIVDDATELETLCLVWINPESEGFAAMSQLAYFREKDYAGWLTILPMAAGSTTTEAIQDSSSPNRLWKLLNNPTPIGIDPDTNRRLYHYEQEIDLSTLNIGMGALQKSLKSQVFLLRAENKGKRCTIVTYAPQGDTVLPEIKITNVVITGSGGKNITCVPNEYVVISQFVDGDTITINGTWKEDSLEKLDYLTYFRPTFDIKINTNIQMLLPALTQNTDKVTGTWSVTTTVKTTASAGQVPLDRLKDTLVINATAKDIGGNVAETGSSWLIASDNLRLMRISSELEDGIYTVGKQVEIFLEFSKPVQLTNILPYNPELILSSAAGNTARAIYKSGQTDQNSRQYFVYTVAAGQNAIDPNFLNVTGLCYNNTVYNTSTAYNVNNYPFAWSRGAGGEYEEVRLTLTAGRTETSKITDASGSYFARTLPTSTSSSDPNYQFTLFAAKHLEIDTTAPSITGVSANTAAGYYNSGDIYMTVTFNEPVTITGVPRLTLQVGSPPTVQTSATASDVRVSGNAITFKYSIQSGDTSNGNQVSVTGFSGTITDLAGNQFLTFGSSRTLTGIYIETNPPSVPTVRVLSTYVANPTASNQVVSQNVSGTTHYGSSSQTNKTLSNLYHENLWFTVQPNTNGDNTGTPYKVGLLEYSTNGGTSWVAFQNITNTPQPLTQTGSYTIIARQKDKAGNVSDVTAPVTFTWDPGALISRISSNTANGTYTHVAGRNQIALTIYFRKDLRIATTTTPQITLNARNSGNNPITVDLSPIPAGAVNSITFNYNVANGDYTPTSPVDTYLDITALSVNITAWDGSAVGNGVNVTNLITLPTGTPKLDSSKQFKVVTGNLTQTPAPSFIEDNQGGTGWNTEGNSNFHGIRSDDGSYWTTLQIPFDRVINRNTGSITITQSATNYRLPAVITEAQYNRFKNSVANIDTYYIKGTNGYDDTAGASDTSSKYVLQYNYNPMTTGSGVNDIPLTFSNAFRNAEAISVNVNAQAVSTSTDGKTLIIRLSGSSAPQVPGATYTVNLPAGLVIDELGNSSLTGSSNVTLRGVAKPFVRIKKTQDTISVNANPSLSVPRLTAAQPFLSSARIDCRTPGSAITYTANADGTNVSGDAPNTTTNGSSNSNNWGTGTTGNNNSSKNNGPLDNPTPNATRPANATGTTYTNGAEIIFGYTSGTTSPDINDVQGFQWWVRAQATATVSGTNYISRETEEIAYRTVITLQVRTRTNVANNTTSAITAGAGRSILEAGDQIWIRGGDAIGSSSIPGFPFTWEDDWDTLSNKRAGIRLMTLVGVSVNMNNSLWRFVTWDMNTTAYVDFIKGRDLTETVSGVNYTASSEEQAWQYGPKRWAYQVDGWTAFKDKYPIFAGKHRWCDMGYDFNPPHGSMNFSGTLMAREDLTADYTRWPGVNTQ
jgi:hypothetical protein